MESWPMFKSQHIHLDSKNHYAFFFSGENNMQWEVIYNVIGRIYTIDPFLIENYLSQQRKEYLIFFQDRKTNQLNHIISSSKYLGDA